MKKVTTIALLVFLLAFPQKAFAFPEIPGLAAAAQVIAQAAERARTIAVEAALEVFYAAEMAIVEAVTVLAEDLMEQDILANLNEIGGKWTQDLRDWTQQLAAGNIDHDRQVASAHDANNITSGALKAQEAEMAAKKQYQPSNQACLFDTRARYLARANQISTAITTGYSSDFSKIGSNDKNTMGATGKAGVNRKRWEMFQSTFCHAPNNNGNAGCTASAPAANRHVLPSQTIFAKETIDTSDPVTLAALKEIIFNITGFDVPDTLPYSTQESAPGQEQRQENREYLTQMDAVGALVYGVVAERIPGAAAPEIQALRQHAGASDASAKPSLREIRQSIIEQLWDPKYYTELNENAATITQKEIYLKAYSLMMLHDMIAKQERISTVYAAETANLLDQTDNSRHAVSSSAPTR